MSMAVACKGEASKVRHPDAIQYHTMSHNVSLLNTLYRGFSVKIHNSATEVLEQLLRRRQIGPLDGLKLTNSICFLYSIQIVSSKYICQNGWSTVESPCICNLGYKGISCQKSKCK